MSDQENEIVGRRELIFADVPGEIPGNLFLSMRLAVSLGASHAERLLVRRESRMVIKRPERALLKLLSQTPGGLAQRAIYAAFWTGALELAISLTGAGAKEARGLWGSMLQQELTTFFLWLPPESTCRLDQAGKRIGVPITHWGWYTHGAQSVARLAYGLLRLRARVYLPRLDEVISGKITLLAVLPGERVGIAFQVKSDFTTERSEIRSLSIPEDDYQRQFLLGVARLRLSTNREWMAAAAWLGLGWGLDEPIHKHFEIRGEVGRFLAHHFPDYSPFSVSRA